MQIPLPGLIAMRKFPFWNRPNHSAHCNYMLAMLFLTLIPQLLDMFKPLMDGAMSVNYHYHLPFDAL